MREGGAKGHSLLLPTGELAGSRGLLALQAYALQQLVGALMADALVVARQSELEPGASLALS